MKYFYFSKGQDRTQNLPREALLHSIYVQSLQDSVVGSLKRPVLSHLMHLSL